MNKRIFVTFKIFVNMFQLPPGSSLWIISESVWEIALLNEWILLKKDIKTRRIVIEKRIQEIINKLLHWMGLFLMMFSTKIIDNPNAPLEREIKYLSSVF
jgi:hypothetical protein